MSSKCNNNVVRIRVRDADGRAWIARVTEEQFRRLQQRCGKSGSVQVAINTCGAVTAILSNGESRTLEQVLHRFRLNFDPSTFQPFISPEWEELREQLMADDGSAVSCCTEQKQPARTHSLDFLLIISSSGMALVGWPF